MTTTFFILFFLFTPPVLWLRDLILWFRDRIERFRNRNRKPETSSEVRVKILPREGKMAPRDEDSPTRFVVDSMFLCELIERLTLTHREDVAYIAGIRLGQDRVLTRIIPVGLDSSSVAHANANPTACAEVMIRLVEADIPLVAMAHSHPGNHPESTRPSGVDLRYLSTIERNGARIIGLIVNRGGCVRFFSAALPFEVHIQGNEFKRVNDHDHVYQLAT